MQADTLLDYTALQTAPLAEDPYPHVIVEGFVPPPALARIYAGLPRMNRGGSFPPDALRMSETARAMMQELEGRRLRGVIAAKLGMDLADAPTMLTVRLYTRGKDGQIHTDSTAKRVTVLLYLNPEQEAFDKQEGCLRLLRSPDDLEDFAVEIPPTRGTLLIFPNGPTAWHGHRAYVGPRHSVQLNYMANDARARAELRRHRLSAWVKRLAFAA